MNNLLRNVKVTSFSSLCAKSLYDIEISITTKPYMIFPIDFKQDGVQLESPYQPLSVTDRFTNLSWGACPKTHYGASEYGVLAGSLGNGSVCLFNPQQIIKSNLEQAHFDSIQQHQGVVTTLDFNNHPQYSSNLACGSNQGEFTIWDILNTSQPILNAPSTTKDKLAQTAVSCVEWNSGVGPIVACGQEGGWISIWDIRAQSKKFQIKDAAMGRPSAICWNPLSPTQFVVAFDEDRYPMLKLWDLRYLQKTSGGGSSEYSPNKEFIGHQKGILSAEWNHDDPSLLISTAKDGMTICWDMSSQVEIYSQMQDPYKFNYNVQWSPTTPGLFQTNSNDGKIYLYNILSANNQVSQDTQEPVPLQRPPKWVQKQPGANFGFGDRLVQLHQQSHPGQTQKSTYVEIQQVQASSDLVQLSDHFYGTLATQDPDQLRSYCEEQSKFYEQQQKAEESEIWRYLQLLYSSSFKESLLHELGFGDVLQIQEQSQPDLVNLQHEKSQTAVQMMDQLANAQDALQNAADLNQQDGNNGQDFFNQPFSPLPNPNQSENFFDNVPTPKSTPGDQFAANAFGNQQKTNSNLLKQLTNEFSGMNLQNEDLMRSNYSITSEETVIDNDIQRALFVGNYEVACQKCLKANRTTDALAIAKFSGSDTIYNKILGDYLEAHGRPYMKILQNFTTGDLEGLIKNRPVMHWKETLALLITYGGEQFNHLSVMLGNRLQAAGQRHFASLCYLCGGDVDKLASVILDKNKLSSGNFQVFEDCFEKTVLACTKYNVFCSNQQFTKLLSLYSQLLTNSGRQDLALEWLNYSSVADNFVAESLKDRIYQSDVQGLVGNYPKPPIPFQMEDLQVSASQYQQQQPKQMQKQQLGKPLQANQGRNQIAQPNAYSNNPYQSNPPQAQNNSYYQQVSGNVPQQGYQQAQYYNNPQQAPQNPIQAQQYYQNPNQVQNSQPNPYSSPSKYTPNQFNTQNQFNQQANQFVPPQTNTFPELKTNKPFQPPQKVNTPTTNTPKFGPGINNPPINNIGPPTISKPQQTLSPQQSAFQPQPIQTPQSNIQPQPKVFKPPQVTPTPYNSVAQPTQNMGGQDLSYMNQNANFGTTPHRYNPAAQPNVIEQNGSAHSDHSQQTQRSGANEPPSNVTLSSADTSQVPSNQISIVQTLRNVFESLRSQNSDPIKRKQLELLDKKIGILVWKLNQNEVSDDLAQNLITICRALDVQDQNQAMQAYQQMQLQQRDEIKLWNVALKKLLQLTSTSI